ncbi:hypothetical protein [Ostreiculturibacter nitratireducens]|uniref:hypothetical protein n=1 Tax=Ostreiculturibacter nitratireducens TaxID=3075226 RepID=UPI0031B5EF32
MRFLAATLVVWFCFAGGLLAETIIVRSGEHRDFTRLVLEPDPPTEWTMGRIDGGYELRLGRAGVLMDTARVFDKISRKRILAVSPVQAGSAIRISVADGSHATAFQTAAGAIVIDVVSGKPRDDSPFERPVASTEVGNEVPAEDVEEAAHADVGPAAEPGPSAMPATAGGIAFLTDMKPRTTQEPDPRLALYRAGQEEAVVEAEDPGPLENPAEITEAEPSEPRRPRVADAEADLLAQLARAATQGLIDPAAASKGASASPASADRQADVGIGMGMAETARSGVDADPEARPGEPPDRLSDSIDAFRSGVRVETSIDREALSRLDTPAVTAEGRACLGNDALAISDWADERPFALQLAEARAALVGEFDIPVPEARDHLARLYLHFGFGAEAMAVQRAFGDIPGDGPLLNEIASILEEGHGSPTGPFSGMADCDTAASLWAVLAATRLDPGDTLNHGAILRTFSGLPLHLRRQFGVELSNRFLGIGRADVARGIRDAIARAPGEHGATVSMMDARLELARGETDAAEELLEDIVSEDGPMSPEAILLAIGSRLDRGAAVEPRLVEVASVLAFEHRGSAVGPDLSRAHVLALAADERFAEAFQELKHWRKFGATRLQEETASALFLRLARFGSDEELITRYFENHDLLDPVAAPVELRLALSERLLDQGFTEEARRVLGSDAEETETGRLFLARAALVDFEPGAALRHLAGMTGVAAMRMRGDGLSRLGRHKEASAAYLAAGEEAMAGSAAWRAGDWTQVATLGSDAERAVVQDLGLLPVAGDSTSASAARAETAALGTLARDRALLDSSREARKALEALLDETSGVLTHSPGAVE